MKISCDFDGVLCKRKGIPTVEDWKNDEPMEGAIDAVKFMQEMGNEVWVMTANGDTKRVKQWLDEKGFPDLEVINNKRHAHVYIDDRCIRFTNWNDIRKYFG